MPIKLRTKKVKKNKQPKTSSPSQKAKRPRATQKARKGIRKLFKRKSKKGKLNEPGNSQIGVMYANPVHKGSKSSGQYAKLNPTSPGRVANNYERASNNSRYNKLYRPSGQYAKLPSTHRITKKRSDKYDRLARQSTRKPSAKLTRNPLYQSSWRSNRSKSKSASHIYERISGNSSHEYERIGNNNSKEPSYLTMKKRSARKYERASQFKK